MLRRGHVADGGENMVAPARARHSRGWIYGCSGEGTYDLWGDTGGAAAKAVTTRTTKDIILFMEQQDDLEDLHENQQQDLLPHGSAMAVRPGMIPPT